MRKKSSKCFGREIPEPFAKKIRKEVSEWSKNIAKNYNSGHHISIRSQLVDAVYDISKIPYSGEVMNMKDIDKRWQNFSAENKVRERDVKWLLTGGNIINFI